MMRVAYFQKYRPVVQIKTVSKYVPNQNYKKVAERETCPPPPTPPPPPPKDDRLLWGALTVIVLAGSFAYYAKQQPEVRDWLTLHAPWFDDFIAVVFQETFTYGEYAERCLDNVKAYLDNYSRDSSAKKNFVDGKVTEVNQVHDASQPPAEEVSKCDVDEKKPKCEVQPPPVLTKDICEIDKCLRELGDEIINNYLTAKEACAYYNRLVEEKMLDFELKDLKELRHALEERQNLIQTSTCNISEAKPKMDDLARYMECGVEAPKQAIAETKGLVNDYRDKIEAARIQYVWEYDKSVELDAQVAKVEEFVNKYVDENETLFTGLHYDSKKPTLNGDTDLLLYQTLRYATKLREELAEAVSNYKDRVNRAMETLPQSEKELKERKLLLGTEIKQRRLELDKEYKKRFEDQKANNEKTLKEALKKQQQRHEEILEQKLEQKEKETEVKLNKMVIEKVAAEKKAFADLLAEMAAKVKAVEDKLNARLKAERETRRSQELWTAGESLLAATKKGDPLVKVDKELKAIQKASGDGDKLVETVLKAIPESVRTEGVVPESVLRERYHRMEKAALAVAMVEADGAPLPIYFLSWLQSMMLFVKLSCIPQKEIDKPLQEPFKDLDTFDLLQRARYYMDRGNIAAAVRYVASLSGASGAAATSWHEAARAHLEIRQAAEAVLAHAAALGLQYI
ncbi:hypothetical protein evm_002664 [Chilo suppressalis]|nr:hypothetical protein evm_002664 [Chilo suppressalis]